MKEKKSLIYFYKHSFLNLTVVFKVLVVVAGRGDFTAVKVDEVDLFKTFSFNGDVADVERRAGLSGDLAVEANDVVALVPFVTFDFTVKDVGLAGTL